MTVSLFLKTFSTRQPPSFARSRSVSFERRGTDFSSAPTRSFSLNACISSGVSSVVDEVVAVSV